MQEEKQEEKQDFPRTPFQIKEENEKEEIIYNNNSKMIFEKNKKGRKKKSEKFVRPTLREVEAYLEGKGDVLFSAKFFWTYYECRDWKIGFCPMTDWKAAIDNWIERDDKKGKALKPATKAVQNVVAFNAYKPVETKGAVSYEEYKRMIKEGKV
ncbi:MAG: hypothetical protein J6W21_00415 [Bacteroidaceae bacterium]|nr:hypothetical protein [Bacteroidaceae bacterium]